MLLKTSTVLDPGSSGNIVINRATKPLHKDTDPERMEDGAHKISILKAGKASDQRSSYRPIALLLPIDKLMEKLILPTLSEHIQPAIREYTIKFKMA